MALDNLSQIGYQVNKHPIAQSFQVDNSDGIFLTKIGVFFSAAPSGLDVQHPITLQLRPITDSGVPSSNVIVPKSTVVKSASTVYANVSTDGSVETTFEFEHPIFLKGDRQYAFVLLTNSPLYKVYIGETYAFKLGTTEERVSKHPASGVLYRSSNSITFSPTQNQDMAFKLYKAKFKHQTAEVLMHNAPVPAVNLNANSITTDSGSDVIKIESWMHGLQGGDQVEITGVSGTIGGIDASDINGIKPITAYDYKTIAVRAGSYTSSAGIYTLDSAKTATYSDVGGTDSATISKNLLYNRFVPKIMKLQPLNTNVVGVFKGTRAEAFSGQGSQYTRDASFSNIDLEVTNTTANNVYLIANAERETQELASGEKSLDVKALIRTNNPNDVSPLIDLQRVSWGTIATAIDNQLPTWETQDSADTASSGSSLYNSSLEFAPETNPSGGNSAAKWISKVVNLEEFSKGIKILLSANRPPYSHIDVYYRVSSSIDAINDQSWVLVNPEKEMPTDENATVFRGYEYLAGGATGTLDDFISMQFKIVMRSSFIHKSPTIRDFRAIALVV